ncbi:MAG: type II methionyl aminopeptidase [Candidatus Lokiarchaeota archaeon]|nr:type II methionyl aminopeptidase [Candidatus Lokiarchaeota archaeon]
MAQEKNQESKSEEELLKEKMENHRQAGKISKEIAPRAKDLVKIGVKLIDICENIENMILEKVGDKGGLAFPCNVSLNNIAAHYSSPPGDEVVIKEGDIVKVDYGIHIDGFISDYAFSVSFNPEHDNLCIASKEAVEAVLNAAGPGVQTNELGKLAEEKIRSYGYIPVIDLSGHLLEQYELHGKKVIPNISLKKGEKLEENEVYAMESFASTGTGRVHEMKVCYIYNILPARNFPRSTPARKILKVINNKYKTLPFAKRWLVKDVGFGFNLGLRELTRLKILHEYHPLADEKGCLVAQTEHSFIVTSDGIEIIN